MSSSIRPSLHSSLLSSVYPQVVVNHKQQEWSVENQYAGICHFNLSYIYQCLLRSLYPFIHPFFPLSIRRLWRTTSSRSGALRTSMPASFTSSSGVTGSGWTWSSMISCPPRMTVSSSAILSHAMNSGVPYWRKPMQSTPSSCQCLSNVLVYFFIEYRFINILIYQFIISLNLSILIY